MISGRIRIFIIEYESSKEKVLSAYFRCANKAEEDRGINVTPRQISRRPGKRLSSR